jgi:glycosyltransferase involved in cell wall biosynthesis
MRILLSNDTFYPDLNGSAYFTQRLASELMKRGHEVLVIAASRSFRNEPSTRMGLPVFGLRSFPIIHYTNFRVVSPIFVEKDLADVIKKFNPDVAHIQSHFTVGRKVRKVASKLGIKVMGTNHFMPENLVPYSHLPSIFDGYLTRMLWRDFKRVFSKLELVTTPTQTAVNLMKKYGFAKPITPISNGIDLKKFRPGNDGKYLKERYKLPDKPILLFVGRLDKEKYVDLILRALADLSPETSPHFLIAGKGFEQEDLKKLTAELGITDRVTFAGFVPDEDLPNLYSVANAFVIAGIAELQSLVTMEAMATGLPVIGVNATALPELIRDGENGYLFPIGDVKKLTECIQKLFSYNAQRERMGKKSLEIISAHDIDKIILKFEEIYRNLSKKSGGEYSMKW